MIQYRGDTANRSDKTDAGICHAQFIAVIRHVRDLAEASRDAAKAAKLGMAIRNQARTLRLRAERLGGQYLANLPLKGGDKRSKWKVPLLTLADLGLDRDSSKRWQLAAKLPEAEFQCYLDEANRKKRELSAASVYRLAKQWKSIVDSPTGLTLALRPRRIHPAYNLYQLVEELHDHLQFIHHKLLERAPRLLDGSSADGRLGSWRRVRTTNWGAEINTTQELLVHLRYAIPIGDRKPTRHISRTQV